MSADALPARPAEEGEGGSVGRLERRPLVGFAADAETAQALRDGLAQIATVPVDVRAGDVRAAIEQLRKMPTPLTLIVDLAGHPQPLAALEDLSHVVEPDVRVLVIGDREDLGFYRQLTRGLGVLDYLYKPVTPAMVAQHFGPVVARRPPVDWAVRGGRIVTVTGVRGGVGATTVAANLAWYLANASQRHTLLLDADLHAGTAALLLNGRTSAGLRAALEHPERVDELFVERTAQPVSDRLHVLAGEESFDEQPDYAPGAAERLLGTLRRRYNFIVVDAPSRPQALHRDLLTLAHQRVLVMEPGLASVRDALRLLQLPPGPAQSRRPVLVLNRADRRGAMALKQVAETMRQQPDVTIPDLPRRIDEAATLGEAAAAARGPFRAAIAKLATEVGSTRAVEEPKRGFFARFRR